MKFLKRTHSVSALTAQMAGKTVVLNGWAHRLRDHGPLQFINLRDRSGVVQTLVESDAPDALKTLARSLKNEYCIAVEGVVRLRPEEMRNAGMAAGDIEVVISRIDILSACETPPFVIEDDETKAKEDLRLKYRYLDLRSGAMQRRMKLRHDVALCVRAFLSMEGFYEIETPIFIKSTPEGARDYVSPSRVYPGQFFALPQSPQLYKQILMVGGMERYFQIARCFRDEDPRGDRQPEFTQIDIEMSFVERDDVLAMTERLFGVIFEKTMGIKLETPFVRLGYYEALDRFGSDKPDMRFGMELFDLGELAAKTEFTALTDALNAGGVVKALIVKGNNELFSRKKVDELSAMAKRMGANVFAWVKRTDAGIEGGAGKFFAPFEAELAALGLEKGDALLLTAGPRKRACISLGVVRNALGRETGLCDPSKFAFCWVVDFPLFEFNEEENKWDAAHHMFSMPQTDYIDSMESDPGAVLGDLYDLVLNGFELASGSIRIHDIELQKRIFRIVGYSDATAQERFGFLLDAFKYGPPPHGGIAPGLDRLVMLMVGQESIREVIAFPKNTQGRSPLDDSPAKIEPKQLDELHLAFVGLEEK